MDLYNEAQPLEDVSSHTLQTQSLHNPYTVHTDSPTQSFEIPCTVLMQPLHYLYTVLMLS